MSLSRKELLKLPLAKRAEMALKAAVRKVIEEHARKGLPIYVWSKGKVVAQSARKLLADQRRRRAKRAR